MSERHTGSERVGPLLVVRCIAVPSFVGLFGTKYVEERLRRP